MKARLAGYTVIADWQPGDVVDVEALRRDLLALPTARSVKGLPSNTTWLEVAFYASDIKAEDLVLVVRNVLYDHARPAKKRIHGRRIRTARELLRSAADAPGACRCDPPYSGEGHCTGACEARAMLVGVKLLQALRAVLKREADAKRTARQVLAEMGCQGSTIAEKGEA